MLAAVLAALAGAARADDIIQPGEEKLTVMLGAFLPAFRTKVEVDGETTGPGDRIDLGDDLGVDQNTSGGWFGVEWRFAPRHRLGFTYSRFTLRGERTIARDLHIGDKVFPIGADLQSQLRLEIVPITYSYSLLKREERRAAADRRRALEPRSASGWMAPLRRRAQPLERDQRQRQRAAAAVRPALRPPLLRALVGRRFGRRPSRCSSARTRSSSREAC